MKNNIQDLNNPLVSLVEDYLEEAEPIALSRFQSNSWEIDVELLSIPPGEIPKEVIFGDYTIGLNVGQGHFIEQIIDGRYSKPFVPTGGIGIFPHQLPMKSRWDNHLDHLYIHLKPDLLARHSEELFEENTVELITSAVTVEDPLIQQLCLAVKQELTNVRKSSSQVYIQSMADALSVHLLQNYSVKSTALRVYPGGLSPRNLKLVREYINDNLEKKLNLDELAQLTKLSRYYFSHAFKLSTGLSPYQYIIKQRIERAKQLLKKGQRPISDIAATCGFTHQSHLNRHFKRLTGLTPKGFVKLENL